MECHDNFDAKFAISLFYSKGYGPNSFNTYMQEHNFSMQQIWRLRRILENTGKSKTRIKKCFIYCAKLDYSDSLICDLTCVWFYGNPAERENNLLTTILEN